MNPDLESLIVLQALDLDLKRLRAELADAPLRVRAAATALAKADATLAGLKQSLSREELLRRSQESDVKSHRDKILRLRRQLDAATSAAQITALEHEIHFAEQAILKLEDEELASLERTDQHEAARIQAAAALDAATHTLAAQREKSAALTAAHTAAIAAIEAERQALRTHINSTDDGDRALSNYDRIAKGKGTGISEAVDHKCAACQMMVRPQRWNDLTNRDPSSEFAQTIFNCETCGRMLFWDPRHDTPGPWPPGERLHRSLHPSSSPS